MKHAKWLLLAAVGILTVLPGCKSMDTMAKHDATITATSTLPIQYNPGGSWFTYFYYMPGTGTAGDPVEYAMSVGNDDGNNGCFVSVWDDGNYIHVKYNTAPDWWLTQVHVDIGTEHDSLAHNKQGNLQPGQFRFPSDRQFDLDPYVQEHTVACEWQDSWVNEANPGYDPELGLLICAHSLVCQWDEVLQEWVNFNTGTGANIPPPQSGYSTGSAWGYNLGANLYHFDNWGVKKWGGAVPYTLGQGPVVVDLWLGAAHNASPPGVDVGSVTITDDVSGATGHVYVTYTLNPGVMLSQTHAGAAVDMPTLRDNSSGFAPGQLGVVHEFDPWVYGDVITLDYDPVWTGSFVVAAHALVHVPNLLGDVTAD